MNWFWQLPRNWWRGDSTTSSFPSVFFVLPSPAAKHTATFSPSSLLLVNNGEHNSASQSHPSTRPFARHSITPQQREQFWLIYIDCWGPFPIHCAPDEKREEERGEGPKKGGVGIRKSQPDSFIKAAPAKTGTRESGHQFPILFFFRPSSWQISVRIRPLFQITHSALMLLLLLLLRFPWSVPGCRCRRRSCTSLTDTMATQ